jgi:hypothetical protein
MQRMAERIEWIPLYQYRSNVLSNSQKFANTFFFQKNFNSLSRALLSSCDRIEFAGEIGQRGIGTIARDAM